MLPNAKTLHDLFSKLNKAIAIIKLCVVCLFGLLELKRMTLEQMINVTDNVLCLSHFELFPLYFHFVMVKETWTWVLVSDRWHHHIGLPGLEVFLGCGLLTFCTWGSARGGKASGKLPGAEAVPLSSTSPWPLLPSSLKGASPRAGSLDMNAGRAGDKGNILERTDIWCVVRQASYGGSCWTGKRIF